METFLEAEIPEDLCRHLFLSFMKRPSSPPAMLSTGTAPLTASTHSLHYTHGKPCHIKDVAAITSPTVIGVLNPSAVESAAGVLSGAPEHSTSMSALHITNNTTVSTSSGATLTHPSHSPAPVSASVPVTPTSSTPALLPTVNPTLGTTGVSNTLPQCAPAPRTDKPHHILAVLTDKIHSIGHIRSDSGGGGDLGRRSRTGRTFRQQYLYTAVTQCVFTLTPTPNPLPSLPYTYI